MIAARKASARKSLTGWSDRRDRRERRDHEDAAHAPLVCAPARS